MFVLGFLKLPAVYLLSSMGLYQEERLPGDFGTACQPELDPVEPPRLTPEGADHDNAIGSPLSGGVTKPPNTPLHPDKPLKVGVAHNCGTRLVNFFQATQKCCAQVPTVLNPRTGEHLRSIRRRDVP